VETNTGTYPAEHVICTIPTPYVSRVVPDLPGPLRQQYDAIPNIGVVCVIFRLKRSVTPHFWVNISDTRVGIPGIVEFSNLRPLPDTVVYVPYYMPATNPRFAQSDADFVRESLSYLRMLNAELTEADVLATRVGRLRHAQPICAPGFLGSLPPVITPFGGLQIADTSYYYPEDRSIAESVRLGKSMAENIERTSAKGQ
jgi:protoporphyrinogen oxidase